MRFSKNLCQSIALDQSKQSTEFAEQLLCWVNALVPFIITAMVFFFLRKAMVSFDSILVDGCHPYSEDLWKTIKINRLTFQGVKLCSRCKVKVSDLVLWLIMAHLGQQRMSHGIVFMRSIIMNLFFCFIQMLQPRIQ